VAPLYGACLGACLGASRSGEPLRPGRLHRVGSTFVEWAVRVAIVGAGLAGLAAAVDLVDAGHQVDLYEARPFLGGKVGSWVDDDGNHIEMGLHVFFFNYANLFSLLRKVGAFENLLPKDHTHLFVNTGGDLRELDFRFALGAPFNGLKAFFTTPQLDWIDKLRNALALGTSPIVRGLVDYEGAMKRSGPSMDQLPGVVCGPRRQRAEHQADVESDRLRPGLHRLRGDLGTLHAHHLHDVCCQDRGLQAQPAQGLTPSLAHRPDPRLHQPAGRPLHLRHRVTEVLFEEGPPAVPKPPMASPPPG
jgi:zeta-carotene desaturase